jgi:hypothetical protein
MLTGGQEPRVVGNAFALEANKCLPPIEGILGYMLKCKYSEGPALKIFSLCS